MASEIFKEIKKRNVSKNLGLTENEIVRLYEVYADLSDYYDPFHVNYDVFDYEIFDIACSKLKKELEQNRKDDEFHSRFEAYYASMRELADTYGDYYSTQNYYDFESPDSSYNSGWSRSFIPGEDN